MTVTPVDVAFTSGADAVRAWLYQAASSEPGPAVVFCPGFTGTKYAAFYQPYVERLVEAGYTVLLIDYRGWGDSGGPRGEIVPLRQVEDIRNGLSFLEARPEVDSKRLSVLGVSFGGGNAVYAAGIDRRIRACIAVSPVADGAIWLRAMRREYEWYEFLDRLAVDRRERVLGAPGATVDPTEEILVSTPERRATTVKGNVPQEKLPRSTPLWCADAIMDFRPVDVAGRARALLLFHVSRDAVVPGTNARALYCAAAEPRRIVELEGDRHYAAYLDHFETIAKESVGWLQAYL